MQRERPTGASWLKIVQQVRCIIRFCLLYTKAFMTLHRKPPDMQVFAQQQAPWHHGRRRAARQQAHSLAAAKSCAFAARQCSGVTPAVSASASRSDSASAQRAWCRTANSKVRAALVAFCRAYSALRAQGAGREGA